VTVSACDLGVDGPDIETKDNQIGGRATGRTTWLSSENPTNGRRR
jgi:hypothetical protein